MPAVSNHQSLHFLRIGIMQANGMQWLNVYTRTSVQIGQLEDTGTMVSRKPIFLL